jgi:tetratricopeptide (TPR) repeat protein
VSAAGPAGPQLENPTAREHFQRAQAHFDDGDYAAAVPELKAAYALDPDPMLLYAWAQAERLSGNCPKAVELYRRYLGTDPAPEQVRLTEANLLDCGAEVDDSDGPHTDRPPRPWYTDWLGGSLFALGAASTITGGVLVALGQQDVDDSAGATTQDEYFDGIEQGRTKNTAGLALVGVGAALVVGSVIRYAVVGTRDRRRASVGLTLPSGGLGLTISGRF